MIKVRYTSVDRVRTTKKFKTLEGARKFAHHWVGEHPEIGFSYAVSGDGIGKIEVDGVSLRELFPERDTPSGSGGEHVERDAAAGYGFDPHDH